VTVDKKKLKWDEFSANVLRNRVNCTAKCPYFGKCPYAKYRNVSEGKSCEVATLTDDQLRLYVSIFIFEEEGLKDQAKKLLWKLGNILNLSDDPKEITMFLELILKYVRAFKMDLKDDTGINEPITIKIDGIESKFSGDPEEKVFVSDDLVVQTDPESLLTSPMLDKLAKKPEDKPIKTIFVRNDKS